MCEWLNAHDITGDIECLFPALCIHISSRKVLAFFSDRRDKKYTSRISGCNRIYPKRISYSHHHYTEILFAAFSLKLQEIGSRCGSGVNMKCSGMELEDLSEFPRRRKFKSNGAGIFKKVLGCSRISYSIANLLFQTPTQGFILCFRFGWGFGAWFNNLVGLGNSSANIWLGGVSCVGKESSIFTCQNGTLGVHNCDAHKQVEVTCGE